LHDTYVFFFFYLEGNASIWIQQHTIYYRPVEENPNGASTSKAGSGSNLQASSSFNSSRKNNKNSIAKLQQNRRKPEFWTDGSIPTVLSPLIPYLLPKLPDLETVEDASLDVLALLRILNGLNRYWSSLYYSVPHSHIIPQSEFIHSKVRLIYFFRIIFVNIKLFLFLEFSDCCQS
jgi:E3 ubiquitin-protein ligase TRIP12